MSTHITRATVAFLIGIGPIATSNAGEAGGQALADANAALLYSMQIRAMVEVCMQETPQVAAHLQHAYDGWLGRHPSITQELEALRSATPSSRADLAALEAAAREYAETLRSELAANPEYFSDRCDHFIKDLDTGELDYLP